MVEPNDNSEAQDSSITSKKVEYTLDGMEEGDATDDVYSRANPAKPGFTKSDQRDMWRMGKVQELKVCPYELSSWKVMLGLERAVVKMWGSYSTADTSLEKLSPTVRAQFRSHINCSMGVSLSREYPRPY